MREIVKLYGDKDGLMQRIALCVPTDVDYTFNWDCMDGRVVFSDIGKSDFLDVCDALEDCLYSDTDESIESVAVHFLQANKLKLAVAESCTGGLVSASVVNVSGASSVFHEGIVTYSNEAKKERLGVLAETLEAFGAVSEETAEEMASGLLSEYADVGVSTTGIAGPLGGSAEKPVGLVYIGVAFRDNPTAAFRNIFCGDRLQVRSSAKNAALYLLWKYLKDNL